MKTRVISTDIWDSDGVYILNIDTKLLYLILLTNPYIGQNRFYKISDRQLSTFSGLNIDQVQKCKKDLESSNMVFFKDNFVCITGLGFIDCFYKGEKNEKAKLKEISDIPEDIMTFFLDKMDSLSIGYEYPIDRTLNTKSGILNTKSGKKSKKSLIPIAEELPKWLDKKVWSTWVQHRKEKRQPLTPQSIKLQVKMLTDYQTEHVAIIEYSIKNGYTGLFAPKPEKKAPQKTLIFTEN